MNIALESRYFHGGPHRPPHIVVRDQHNRVFSVDWDFSSRLSEEGQHWHAANQALASFEELQDVSYVILYSARWKSGWRHTVVNIDESSE